MKKSRERLGAAGGLAVLAVLTQGDPTDVEGQDYGDDEKENGGPKRNDEDGAYGEGRDCGKDAGHLVGEPVTDGRVGSLHGCRLDFQRRVAGWARDHDGASSVWDAG